MVSKLSSQISVTIYNLMETFGFVWTSFSKLLIA